MEYSYTIQKGADGTVEDIIAQNMETQEVLSLNMCCSEEREMRLATSIIEEVQGYDEKVGVVVLGVGRGIVIQMLEEHLIPCYVVDIEEIAEEIGIPPAKTTSYSKDKDSEILYASVLEWQLKYKGLSVVPLLHPFHRKVHKEVYGTLFQQFKDNVHNSVWKGMRSIPLFRPDRATRVLILPDYYCMTMNVVHACHNLGIEVYDVLLPSTGMTPEWYAGFLKKCVEFQPDFILTFNHLGIDNDSPPVILNAIEAMNIPIASWFVDSPDILIGYDKRTPSPLVHIFLWEQTRIAQMQALGYNASYLPLASDPKTFYPIRRDRMPKSLGKYRCPLMFLGATGVIQGAKNLLRNIFPYSLHCAIDTLYEAYISYPKSSLKQFLEEQHLRAYDTLSDAGKREFALYLFFYMHTKKRVDIMEQLLEFSPVIAGDEGWKEVLPFNAKFTLLPIVDYIFELTAVYQCVDINLNITSPQMKNAVNQRVFDVPMSNAFVITDNQPVLPELFEVGKEIICYNNIEELKELISYYKVHPKERRKIIDAGRKRVLREHTYEHRMKVLVDTMKKNYT